MNLSIRRPDPPHNTTQYIIDANHRCTGTPDLYMQHHNRFEYDFQHHAMAGSMMDLMKNKFTVMYDECGESSSNQEKIIFMQEEPAQEVQDYQIEDQEKAKDQEFQDVSVMKVEEPLHTEENGRWVNHVASGLDTDYCLNISDRDDKERNPYSHYLRQAEIGENLQDVVRHLIGILTQKDQQISVLKERVQLQQQSISEIEES
jgi:hypothetical protein